MFWRCKENNPREDACTIGVFATILALVGCSAPARQSLSTPQPQPLQSDRQAAAEGGAGGELPDDTITIATFNIQVFGKAKCAKPEVMDILVKVVRQYDVVAIQEIKDAGGDTPATFLSAINTEDGPRYAMLASPPSGATAGAHAREQYAFYFNTETIRSLSPGALYPDPQDAFLREPFSARFEAAGGSVSFVLLDIHTHPESAVAEVGKLHEAVEWARSHYAGEDDFIVLGDYNASCRYASARDLDALAIRGAGYLWLVPDAADTNLAASHCAYDRIVITAETGSDYAGRWGVNRAFTDKAVSDHWPVWMQLYSKRERRVASP